MAATVLEIIITPITELAKLFVVPLKRQVGYLVKFHKNIEDLKTKIEDLGIARETAICTTNEARRRGETITQDMEQWINKSAIIMTDAHNLLAKLQDGERRKSDKSCTRRYVSSKKAVKLLKIVNELKGSVQQIPVSRPAPPPSIEVMPTGDFQAFESTRTAVKKILEAIKHDENHIIGVYGMGGVGKTSLIKEVAKQTMILGLFDEVVIATVSRNPDMRKIQREIAEGLGLQLTEESEHVRSLRLAIRMKQESRILIILDDVWERLDLSKIGISFGKDIISSCKIAITTRSLDVCSEMDCDKSLMIDTFSEQDSWNLFKKIAGDIVDSPDLNGSASEIVRECGGLPIALVTLGRVLRNKEPRFWADAAYELRQSRPLNIKGMHENVFWCLKLSFDEFQNEDAQMCFLYCALFPEDYDVHVEDLLRYGIGERLFSDVTTLDEARNRVHSIISNLKASCLLLNNTNNQVCVKMHDVFRDLAISIATTNDYSFMVKASSGLKEWPRNLKLEYVMRMSLINNEISKFSGQGEYPELILLLLQNNTSLMSISDEFFAGMKSLQVLDLSNIPSLVALPTSLSSLTNLRTLCMDNNRLEDGSVLGELKSIEILSLRTSSFRRFPEEIGRLTNLRLLDLSNAQVDEIPDKVFSSLLLLEELYMGGSYNRWEMNETKGKGKATLAEILSLERLNILHIDIGNYACLTEEIINHQAGVKKFHLHIGERVSSPLTTTNNTSICFNLPAHYRLPKPLMNWLKSFLQITLQLSILSWKHLSSLEDLQPDYLQLLKKLQIEECDFQTCFSSKIFENFASLQEVQIISCFELNSVFLSNDRQVTHKNVFPQLSKMYINNTPRLTALWKGVSPHSTSFQSLKHVKVEVCAELKILFCLGIAKSLNQLQCLEISDCDAMEAVISSDIEGESNLPNSWVPIGVELMTSLHYKQPIIFPELQILKLNNLKSITSVTQPWFPLELPKLEHVFVQSCPSLKLRVGPKEMQRLIEIKAEREWFEDIEVEDDKTKETLQKCFTELST